MRLWLVAVLAGVLGFALAWWMGAQLPAPTQQAAVGAPAMRAEQADAVLAAVTSGGAAAPTDIAENARQPPAAVPTRMPPGMPAEAPAPEGPRLAPEARAFLGQWPARLDELAQRAKAGDARAMTDLGEALDYCTSAESMRLRVQNPSANPVGDLTDLTIQAYFAEIGSQCKAWRQRHPWVAELEQAVRRQHQDFIRAREAQGALPREDRPPVSASEALRRRAAQAGDAIAEGLSNDRELHRACGGVPPGQMQPDQRQYHQCLHAAARDRLRAIFARRDPHEIEAMPRILMAMGPILAFGSEYLRTASPSSEENNARWILAACAFGLDCGPSGRALRWACANLGACGYRHYREFAADQLLPPAAMRRVEGQLPRLVASILAGDVDAVLGPPPRH